MIFILDNNIFSDTLKNIPLEHFYEQVYQPFEQLIKEGIVISVDEVYRELEAYFGGKSQEMNWLNMVKDCFQYLSNKDCANLMCILKNKKFQEGIKEKSIRSGSPEADAMLVAKAMTLDGIVVTNESNTKRNADKVPNICVAHDIPYILKKDFYKVLKNKAEGKDLLERVKVYTDLEEITDN